MRKVDELREAMIERRTMHRRLIRRMWRQRRQCIWDMIVRAMVVSLGVIAPVLVGAAVLKSSLAQYNPNLRYRDAQPPPEVGSAHPPCVPRSLDTSSTSESSPRLASPAPCEQ